MFLHERGLAEIFNADAQAPHQAVIGVMEAARLAGIVRISFATQRTDAGK